MSPTEGLQFQTAEFAGRKCTVCQTVLGDSYYHLQGLDACPTCAQARLESQGTTDSGGKMMKGLLWGSGAALLGSAAFAAVAIQGFQLSILSIGIGWLVGTAIKKGTAGHTSRKYQVMAVILTYLAIASSYIPVMIAQMPQEAKDRFASTVNKGRAEANASPRPRDKPNLAVALLALGVAAALAFVLVLALPVIDAFTSLPGGLLTLLIAFFGLQQAWKRTAPDVALVAGPYQSSPS